MHRPGDTILIAPGVRHVDLQLEVMWPLKIVGAGEAPEDTVFIDPFPDAATITFRWLIPKDVCNTLSRIQAEVSALCT